MRSPPSPQKGFDNMVKSTLALLMAIVAMLALGTAIAAPSSALVVSFDSDTVHVGDPVGVTIDVEVTDDPSTYSVQGSLPEGFVWFVTEGPCFVQGTSLFCGIFVGEVNRVHAELVGVPTGSRSCGWYTVTASLHVGLNSVTTSSDAVQVLCPASLGISKVAQTPFASMGDIVSFKVSVSNFGQEPSGVFQVNDPLPVGLTWFVQGAFNMECQVTARILYCEGDRLPPGTTAYTIVYAVATNCGSYVNPEATLIQGHRAVAATAAIISIACPPIPTATATATSTPTQTRPPQVSVTPTRIVPGPPNTGGGLGTNDHSWWMIPSILLLGGLVAYILGRRGG